MPDTLSMKRRELGGKKILRRKFFWGWSREGSLNGSYRALKPGSVQRSPLFGLEGDVLCGRSPAPAIAAGGRHPVHPLTTPSRPGCVYVVVYVQARNGRRTEMAVFAVPRSEVRRLAGLEVHSALEQPPNFTLSVAQLS